MNNQINESVNRNVKDKSSCRKTYSTPTLQIFGEVKNLTAGGSDVKMENGGHPIGMP